MVDDEPGLRQVLEIAFKRHGIDVVTAPGVRTALEALAQNPQPFPLVGTDLVMPDGSWIWMVLCDEYSSSNMCKIYYFSAHLLIVCTLNSSVG